MQFSLSSLYSITTLKALFHHYSILLYILLFIKFFNQSFNKSFFIYIIYHLLLNTDISIIDYSRHSLQKSVTVIADRNDISRPDIKLLKCWKSDVVDIYINKRQKSDHIRKILRLNAQLLSLLH